MRDTLSSKLANYADAEILKKATKMQPDYAYTKQHARLHVCAADELHNSLLAGESNPTGNYFVINVHGACLRQLLQTIEACKQSAIEGNDKTAIGLRECQTSFVKLKSGGKGLPLGKQQLSSLSSSKNGCARACKGFRRAPGSYLRNFETISTASGGALLRKTCGDKKNIKFRAQSGKSSSRTLAHG